MFTLRNEVHSYNTKNNSDTNTPQIKTEIGRSRLQCTGANLWNELDIDLQSSPNLKIFKNELTRLYKLTFQNQDG